MEAQRLQSRVRTLVWSEDGSRCRRIWLLMAAVWLMNGFDLTLTLHAHAQGLLNELNPIAVHLLPLGPAVVTVFKITLVAFGSWILLHHRRHAWVEVLSWMVAGVYVGVSLRWMFCYDAYHIIVSYQYFPPLRNPFFG